MDIVSRRVADQALVLAQLVFQDEGIVPPKGRFGCHRSISPYAQAVLRRRAGTKEQDKDIILRKKSHKQEKTQCTYGHEWSSDREV